MTRRDVEAVLSATGLPRARYLGPDSIERWTYGWGTSVADGQVTVWCNPGGPSREAWFRSARLADRVDQALVIAGFPTYRDAHRDPQQIIVLGPRRPIPLPPRRRLERQSIALSVVGIVLCITSVVVNGPGLALAAALFLAAAIWRGIRSENHPNEGTNP